MADFAYEDLLPIGADETPYRLLTTEGVRAVDGPGGRTFLEVDPEALRLLTETAMHDIAHYLRPAHLQQLRTILEDDEASNNDKFVALDLLIAKLFLKSENTTVIVKLQQLLGSQGQGQELLTAGAFITIIVPMIVFVTLQRYMIRGMTSGAVKG